VPYASIHAARRNRRKRQKHWLARRKLAALEALGGQCADCGDSYREAQLEFDHIVREGKAFNILARLSYRWPVLVEELKKCQLLCRSCHYEKTARENRALARPNNEGDSVPL